MPNTSQPRRFRSKLVKCKTLDSDEDLCSVLSQSLTFLYCNPAWDAFALSNGGTEAALARSVIGRNLLDFIPPVLQAFFSERLSSVLGEMRMWDHFYECSSPSEFRIFRLQALALHDAGELLVCHTAVHAAPHYRPPSRLPTTEGPVRICCHCRKAAKADDGQKWLWAPELLIRPPRDRVNDLCPECSEYYNTGHAPWPEQVWKAPSWVAHRWGAGD
jgi:hypothetical protein